MHVHRHKQPVLWGRPYPARRLYDHWNRQHDVVCIHQAHCDASEARKGCVDCIVGQNLYKHTTCSVSMSNGIISVTS